MFVCIKTIPGCIHKKKLKLCFCVWTCMTWPRISESTLPLKYHPTTLERQLKYPKCFATMCLWQSNNLSTMHCHQSFLVQCFLSTYWIFFLSFLNDRVFDKFIQFKSCVKSASHYLCCFNGFTDSYERARPWQCVKWACDSVSFNMCCYASLSTNHVGCFIMTLKPIIP